MQNQPGVLHFKARAPRTANACKHLFRSLGAKWRTGTESLKSLPQHSALIFAHFLLQISSSLKNRVFHLIIGCFGKLHPFLLGLFVISAGRKRRRRKMCPTAERPGQMAAGRSLAPTLQGCCRGSPERGAG